MIVTDVMQTDIATISPMATVREAMKTMRVEGTRFLVVERQGPNDAYGIISFTSILRTIVAEEGDIDLINVYDICVKPAISVHPDMDVKYVARMMINQSFRRLLVVRDNELAGAITREDIVAPILELAETS